MHLGHSMYLARHVANDVVCHAMPCHASNNVDVSADRYSKQIC